MCNSNWLPGLLIILITVVVMPLTLSLCSRSGGMVILRLSVSISSVISYSVNGKSIVAVVDPAKKVALMGVEM